MKALENYDLWEMTRTDDILHQINYHTKEIATEIRKHLRARFPMCKWSVTSDYNSIDVYIKCSPYDKESEEMKAIVKYAALYTNSFNYDHSDAMTDYFDVNFYSNLSGAVKYDGDVYTGYCLHYTYEQRDMTESEKTISQKFMEKLDAWNESERIRKEEEYKAYCKQREIEEKEYRERVAREAEIRKQIEEGAVIDDNVSFSRNCITAGSKFCSVDEYKKYIDQDIQDGIVDLMECRVSRAVYLSKELYENFTDMFLDDFSFLEGMGGYGSDDERVQNRDEYLKMSSEEMKTVKWYNCNCVAIYCDDKLELIIDPEGYSYARYVYFPA